jgi:hypothetical protein
VADDETERGVMRRDREGTMGEENAKGKNIPQAIAILRVSLRDFAPSRSLESCVALRDYKNHRPTVSSFQATSP